MTIPGIKVGGRADKLGGDVFSITYCSSWHVSSRNNNVACCHSMIVFFVLFLTISVVSSRLLKDDQLIQDFASRFCSDPQKVFSAAKADLQTIISALEAKTEQRELTCKQYFDAYVHNDVAGDVPSLRTRVKLTFPVFPDQHSSITIGVGFDSAVQRYRSLDLVEKQDELLRICVDVHQETIQALHDMRTRVMRIIQRKTAPGLTIGDKNSNRPAFTTGSRRGGILPKKNLGVTAGGTTNNLPGIRVGSTSGRDCMDAFKAFWGRDLPQVVTRIESNTFKSVEKVMQTEEASETTTTSRTPLEESDKFPGLLGILLNGISHSISFLVEEDDESSPREFMIAK